MEKIIDALAAKKAQLEQSWQALPAQRRKKVVIYIFIGYLALTVGVLTRIVSQLGSGRDTIEMEHITNPTAATERGAAGITTKTERNGK
jgi:hypothetical protein